MLRKGVLIKRTTDDGLVEIQDAVELGREYLIDDNTIRMAAGFNHVVKKKWVRLIVDVLDGAEVRWFPTELLRME